MIYTALTVLKILELNAYEESYRPPHVSNFRSDWDCLDMAVLASRK